VIDESTHLKSNKRRGWRRPGGLGYSVHAEEAGRFTRQQALEECRRALVGWRPGTPYPDIPVAERYVMLILGRGELGNASPLNE